MRSYHLLCGVAMLAGGVASPSAFAQDATPPGAAPPAATAAPEQTNEPAAAPSPVAPAAGRASNVPAGEDFGSIVVTARRREESLQSVPVAVTAISGQQLASVGGTTVQDLTRTAPSITIGASSRGGSVPFVSIRGISTSDVVAALDPSVGIYMDDVIQQRPNGVLTSLFDIDNVQVLRGPQGTLFGRNTVGGAILINSRQPTDEFGGYLHVGFGNYAYKTADGALNVPLSDTLQLRVAGQINRRRGYVTSVTTGQHQMDMHDESGRAILKWEPSDSFKTTTIVSMFKNDSNGGGGITPGLLPPGAFTAGRIVPANSFVADPTNRAAIAAAGLEGQLHFYHTSSGVYTYDHTKTFNLTNTSTLKLDQHFSLKSILGYRYSRDNLSIDPDGSAAPQLDTALYNHFKQTSAELQLLGDFNRFNFILGGYYFRERGYDAGPALIGVPLALINNPPSTTTTGGIIANKSYSGFANATINVTNRLKVGAGVRYTEDKRFAGLQTFKTLNPYTANPTTVCAVGTLVSDTVDASGQRVIVTSPANPCELDRSISSNAITYSVDVDYKVSDNVLLYVAHRKGYHSAALNQRATFIIEGADFAKPEYLKDVEIGLKSTFNLGDVRGRFNVAAYYGWYTNLQRNVSLPLTIINGTPSLPTVLGNAAKAHIDGVELEGSIIPAPGLEISGYFAFNDTHYDNYIDTSVNPPLDRSNDLFTYAPRYTGGGTIRYTMPVTDDNDLTLQANAFFTSKFNDQLSQQPVYTILPGYSLFNFRAELTNLFHTGLDAAAFVNNAFGKKYYTGGMSSAAIGAVVRIPGPPRMFGVELKYSFGGERR